MRRIEVIIAAAGLTLFIIVASRIGMADVIRQLQAIPIALPILIGLSFLRLVLQTLSWSKALRAEGIRCSSMELIGIRMAAQSLGYVSAVGLAVSEPMKLKLLGKSLQNAISPTLADTIVYGFSSASFGFAGCLFAGLAMDYGKHLAASAALGAVFGAGLYLIGRRRPLLSPLVRRLSLRCPRWLSRGEQIEVAIRQFRARHQNTVGRMFWLNLGCQVLLAGEVAAVLWILRMPFHAGIVLALEAASRAVKMAAGWMPARIGADETGTVAAFAALGLPSSSGLALALTRRARDLLVCVLGFGWLLWRTRRLGGFRSENG